MNRRTVARGLLLASMALLGVHLGCEDDGPCRPPVPAGRISGHVRTGGLPIDAVVSAVPVDGEYPADPVFETLPEADGEYRLDLPAGRYVVQLRVDSYRTVYDYAGAELGYGQIPPETVLVDHAHSPVAIDFDLGGLTLQVDLSHLRDGETGGVLLHRRDAVDTGEWRTFVDSGYAEIVDGRFDISIAGILPGEYQVEVVLGAQQYYGPPLDGEHFWMPGTLDPTESPWYEVAADSAVDLSCVLDAVPARIEGRILGAWQDMGLASGPEVSIVSLDSVTVAGAHRVDLNGGFAFDIHVPAPVKVLVTQNGLLQWIGGPGFDEATVYDLEAGKTISGVECVQSGLRLQLDPQGMRLGWAAFNFYDPIDRGWVAAASIDAQSDWDIAIPNLWPGDFLMRVTPYALGLPCDWRPQWFDRAVDAEHARVITIAAPGDIVPLDLTLERGGAIRGRVEQQEGPQLDYFVLVTPGNIKVCSNYGYAWDSRPEFSVIGLPDGDFKVGVWPIDQGWEWPDPPPEGTIWYPGTSDWESAAVVEVLDAGVVTDVDFVLP